MYDGNNVVRRQIRCPCQSNYLLVKLDLCLFMSHTLFGKGNTIHKQIYLVTKLDMVSYFISRLNTWLYSDTNITTRHWHFLVQKSDISFVYHKSLNSKGSGAGKIVKIFLKNLALATRHMFRFKHVLNIFGTKIENQFCLA